MSTTKTPPVGFDYVSPTADELARRGKSNGRMLVCLRCGTRIWGSGMGIGSHRRACEHKAWLDNHPRDIDPDPSLKWAVEVLSARSALEAGDYTRLVAAVRALSTPSGDCWVWHDLNHRGFPTGIHGAGVRGGLHKQLAHTAGQRHANDEGVTVTRDCGNTGCVNPRHIRVLGNRYSVAEYAERGVGSTVAVPPMLDNLFAEIASVHLGIDTLETRSSDRLDFHEVAVWQVREALEQAWVAGRNAGRQEVK